MVIQINESGLATIEQIREFLGGTADVGFSVPSEPAQLRAFVGMVLSRFKYAGRSKTRRTSYACKFTIGDIGALAEIDGLHDTLSGPATRVLLHRAWHLFHDERYRRLADISVSHLYNLRASARYRHLRIVHRGTRATQVAIGVRKAPAPQGLPGYIRIDTVHQGDQDGAKGLYHINAVDIVTQWQIVASVQRIGEAYLLPVIAQMLEGFPFLIRGFHSDNGSEYVNGDVARLLNKLHAEFTKSRPRHSNDNALVECKNGVVIRKLMGYAHIPQLHARAVNLFYANSLNPYLNFHRPCFFAVDTLSPKGKIVKTYPNDKIMTPWDLLRQIQDLHLHLKPGITALSLAHLATRQSDSQAASQLQKARTLLFQSFNRRTKSAA